MHSSRDFLVLPEEVVMTFHELDRPILQSVYYSRETKLSGEIEDRG